jgi:hypothetical protein
MILTCCASLCAAAERVLQMTDKHLLIADMAIPSQSEIFYFYYKKLHFTNL